jgi:hypothetical protein
MSLSSEFENAFETATPAQFFVAADFNARKMPTHELNNHLEV